jgi:hypothetical protein
MAEPQLGKVEAGDERIDDADKGIGRDVVIHARRQQACLGAIDSFNEAHFQSPSARALPQIVFVASVSPESAPRESQRQWSRLRGPRCGGRWWDRWWWWHFRSGSNVRSILLSP